MDETDDFDFIGDVDLVPAAVRAQDDVTLYNGNWGIGFEVGAGALAPTGSLNDNLKACALFTGGINAEYGRVRLKPDMDLWPALAQNRESL